MIIIVLLFFQLNQLMIISKVQYMDLYPHITYYRGYEQYTNGDSISKGYYVQTEKNGYIRRKGRKIWQDECFLVFTMIMILTDLWLLEIVG